MKQIMTEEGRAEYDKYMNEQFRILQGHFSRIMLRCYNKFVEIAHKENQVPQSKLNKEVKQNGI